MVPLTEGLYFLAIDCYGSVDDVFKDGDAALDHRAINPELIEKVIPVADLNQFSHTSINTEEEALEVLENINKKTGAGGNSGE